MYSFSSLPDIPCWGRENGSKRTICNDSIISCGSSFQNGTEELEFSVLLFLLLLPSSAMSRAWIGKRQQGNHTSWLTQDNPGLCLLFEHIIITGSLLFTLKDILVWMIHYIVSIYIWSRAMQVKLNLPQNSYKWYFGVPIRLLLKFKW